MRPEFYTGRDGNYNAIPDITWFDENGESPEWDDPGFCLALRMDGSRADIQADRDDNDFFIMFNSGKKNVRFVVCDPLNGRRWVRVIDTGLPSPQDILSPENEAPLEHSRWYDVAAHSMVVLVSQLLYW
jgi:glycogen operon protein